MLNDMIFGEDTYPLEPYKSFKEDCLYWMKIFLNLKISSLSKRLVEDKNAFKLLAESIGRADNTDDIAYYINQLSRLGFKGLKTYANPLIKFYEYANDKGAKTITDISDKTLRHYLANEFDDYETASIQNHLRSIKSFLTFIEDNSTDPGRDFVFKIRKDISKVIPRKTKEKKHLDPNSEYYDFETAIETIKFEKKIAARNRLMIKLYFYTGIRTNEALTIKTKSIKIVEKRNDETYFTFKVIGKGNKELQKRLPYSYIEKDYKEWLDIRKEHGLKSALLICTLKDKKVIESYAYRVTRRILESIGVYDDEKMGAHRIRHSVATKKLDEGYDLSQVQDYLSHADIATTRGYVAVTRTKLDEMSKRK